MPDFRRKLVVNIKKFDFNHFDREIFFCLFMDQLMSVFVLILSANDPDPDPKVITKAKTILIFNFIIINNNKNIT